MHGAGNDFVMIDGRDLERLDLLPDRRLIARLCHRRLFIGADGLIVVAPDVGADFAMTYWNSDGGEAAMCGNGARCAFAFARARGLIDGPARCRTASGILTGEFPAPGRVTVDLTPPRDLRLDVSTDREHPFARIHAADTGVPHVVIPVENLETVDVSGAGAALRHDPAFAPGGTNVNWVQPAPGGAAWLIRTYERGVESETLACGTGASAAALVLCRLESATSPVTLLTRGGDTLTIEVGGDAAAPSLRLTGPVAAPFSGEVEIDD
jgi:diaminopimelate epimerase